MTLVKSLKYFQTFWNFTNQASVIYISLSILVFPAHKARKAQGLWGSSTALPRAWSGPSQQYPMNLVPVSVLGSLLMWFKNKNKA